MAVYSKSNPIGLDKKIYKIQQKLNSELDWTNFDIYGRLYVNQNSRKEKIAEAYTGNNEYKEVFLDDTKNAIFGFFVSDTRNGLNMIHVSVELVCSCNLYSIYGTNERNDEETIALVSNLIRRITLIDNETNIKTGLENVFSRVSIDRFKFRDMQPWFNFSIGFDLVYKI